MKNGIKNIVFIGGTGCGKSEACIRTALELSERGAGQVHLFDLDQTKPLFRSRDIKIRLEAAGVVLHAQNQMMDAPTMVGGVVNAFLDPDAFCVVDAGGGDTGARLLGGFSHLFSRPDTEVIYMINPYRPWSDDIYSVDCTMSEVLRAARIRKYTIVGSPNLGHGTTAEEFLEGCRMLKEMLEPYVLPEYVYAPESIYEAVKDTAPFAVVPVRLSFFYPWDD